ncbi:MAG: LysR family transcriptional regulator [Bdellovibrionales bacterium]|nr:LysR family transcriptional regulator [Bdellovibrionales bacterium]
MSLNNIDLNKLKCFQAVAEKGTLLEGAKYLNLTPSAVYQSIKKLELDMQTNLFFRAGKKYILTEDGISLQALFERFLWDFLEFQDKSRLSGQTFEGEIRVGLPLNFSKSSFIPIFKKFQEEFPRVRFHLTIAETRRLIDLILNFEMDFAITDDAIPHESLAKISKREVFKEELVMVCSKNFSKEHAKELTSIKTLKDLPHLDYSRNLPLVQRWYKLHYRRQVKISDFHTIDNVETMVAALREGLGLAIIPKSLLDSQLSKDLQVVTNENGLLHNQLYLVQEYNYINNRLMKKFLQFMEESLSSH